MMTQNWKNSQGQSWSNNYLGLYLLPSSTSTTLLPFFYKYQAWHQLFVL